MGRRYPAFQTETSVPYALTADGNDVQPDPLPGDPNFMRDISQWDDGTNAAAFVTVYANKILNNGTNGLDLVTDDGLTRLAKRFASQIQSRQLYIRWCPEMNGEWFYYGPPTTPEYFVQVWKRMYSIFKQYVPSAQIVWSPNFDLPVNDTRYWPGADYVDWVGTSVYYKGFGYNDAMPVSYISESIDVVYSVYAAPYNKPFVISEASGAWESGSGKLPGTGQFIPNVTASVDQATFQKHFWAPLLNATFMDQYPLLKAAYIFDVAKQEEFYTDFRVSNDTATRLAFNSLVDALDAQGRMNWADSGSPVVTVTASATATKTSGAGASTFVGQSTSKSGARSKEKEGGARKERRPKEREREWEKVATQPPQLLTTHTQPVILQQRPNPHSTSNSNSASSSTPSVNAAPSQASHPMVLKLLAEPSPTNPRKPLEALAPSVFSEAPGCFIVGVLGRKGVGKTTILNLLAKQTNVNPFNSKTPTRGIDLHVTGDGLVLLDMQSILLPKKSSARKGEDLASAKTSERLSLFLFSVCHVILVVSSGSSTRDDEMWGFLRRMEAAKYRAYGGTGPIEIPTDSSSFDMMSGKQRRQRRRRRGGPNVTNFGQEEEEEEDYEGNQENPRINGRDDDDDEEEDDVDKEVDDEGARIDDSMDNDSNNEDQQPMSRSNRKHQSRLGTRQSGSKSKQRSSQPQTMPNTAVPAPNEPDIFFPDLIFIHNRAKPSDYAENNYSSTCFALSRAFRGSRLKVSSGILNFGHCFPQIYPSTREPCPNYWILPPFPSHPPLYSFGVGSSASSSSILEKLSDFSTLKSVLKESEGVPARYDVLCDMLRDSVLEVARYPFELPAPLSTVYKTFDAESGKSENFAGGNSAPVAGAAGAGTFIFLFISLGGVQSALKTNAADLATNPTFAFIEISWLLDVRSLHLKDQQAFRLFLYLVGLATAVFFAYRISGGALNPAVNFGLFVAGVMDIFTLTAYTLAQLAGATAACAAVDLAIPGDFNSANQLFEGVNYSQGFVIESVLTAGLVLTVLFLAVEKSKITFWAPMLIGIYATKMHAHTDITTVFTAHLLAIPYTNTAINPARTFGAAIVIGNWDSHISLFWLAPLTGGAIAGQDADGSVAAAVKEE
ncbi:UNVERIFIED_CONTAM: hypothetical protein HDU68_003907 [Siphonaria sp. JEL0065]|nr:hypothetical protein HDU68_003907 [Siphonaria sp. JEL0065]